MKNRIYLIAFILFCNISAFAQAPSWQWAKSAGGADTEQGNSVAIDHAGNVIVVGYFRHHGFISDLFSL